MVTSGADLFNVDHLVDLNQAVTVYGQAGRCFKGNLDPVVDVLQATPEECSRKARACVRIAGGGPYMLSAGCEIPAEVSDKVFEAFCRSVLR